MTSSIMQFSFRGLPVDAKITIELANGKAIIVCSNGAIIDTDRDHSTPVSKLKSLSQKFILHLESKGVKHIRDYRSRINQFIGWVMGGGVEIVTDDCWCRYIGHLHGRDLANTTIRNYYRTLNVFAEWLVQGSELIVNPLADITPPKAEPGASVSESDIAAMIDEASSNRDKSMLLLFRDTGCRSIEALRLQWSDIDYRKCRMKVTGKFNKRRVVFFTPETAQYLQAYYNELNYEQRAGAMWWNTNNREILEYSGLYQIFSRIAKRIGVKTYNPQGWRHQFARRSTRNGIPTTALQQLMGHESIETTRGYSDLDTDELDAVYRQYCRVDARKQLL